MNSRAEIPKSLQHSKLSSEDMIAAQTLASMKHRNNPPTLLLQLYKLKLTCTSPFRKTLVASDADYRQDRLVIPKDQVTSHILPFLNAEANENPSFGIPISVYDTSGAQYLLRFLQRNDDKFVVTHRQPNGNHWRDICKENGFQPGVSLTFWTLRHSQTNELCFVIERDTAEGECLFPLFFALILC